LLLTLSTKFTSTKRDFDASTLVAVSTNDHKLLNTVILQPRT